MTTRNDRLATAARTRYWIGVASRDHVLIGQRGGFAQFGHGKRGPAARLSEGDWVVYYSGTERYGEPAPCQRFTAIGQVVDTEPVQVDQAPGFHPYRRKVRYDTAREIAIRPLIERLSFITNKARWGAAFRFGFLEIPAQDFRRIAARMRSGAKKQEAAVAADTRERTAASRATRTRARRRQSVGAPASARPSGGRGSRS